jgi:hypothetical protein
MKKRIRKITLHRETLRNLTEQHLEEARGGIQSGINTICPTNCLATCITQCQTICHSTLCSKIKVC